MARVEKADRGVAARLDELEQRIFLLKIEYEKYFSGIEKIEPVRDREEVRRLVRDLMEENIKSSTQRFRFQSLKSRFQSFELYWTRNLVMIERGTHPKMKFRADLKGKKVVEAEPGLSAEQQEVLRQRKEQMEREDRAFRIIYDKYMEARTKCGQSADLSFDAVREALKKQVRTIKSTYQCESVKFRVVVEEGKAKLKAVPQGVG
ncbi:MAG: MXAN_5187 C-terminal domain-containing protein [Myxococcota bacterium]